ncbi:MAG: TlpA family protein disulfide reductase, partial [Chloroflexota bacterium]
MASIVSEKVRVLDTADAVDRLFYGRGWTDGLPVVAPTEERIIKMLSGTHRDAQQVITAIPPKWGPATVEKIAINCVMA